MYTFFSEKITLYSVKCYYAHLFIYLQSKVERVPIPKHSTFSIQYNDLMNRNGLKTYKIKLITLRYITLQYDVCDAMCH